MRPLDQVRWVELGTNVCLSLYKVALRPQVSLSWDSWERTRGLPEASKS